MPDNEHGTADYGERFREACGHAKEASSSLRRSIEELIPPGFIEHRRAARREMLLALRSLLDAAIERGDKRTTG
jgi:hypothetical protein